MYTEKPQTLKEMRKMQEHYIALEEIQEGAHDRSVQEASTSAEIVPKKISKRSEKRSGPQSKELVKKEWVEKGKKPQHGPKVYTPLNAPLEEIFKEVEKRNDIRYPKTRGVQFDETKNHPEFCHYHQFRGHSTNNFREVKDIVHHLTRDGYLRKFVKHPASTPDAPVHQVRIEWGTQFLCNTISHSSPQGFDLGAGIMSRIHKRYRSGNEIFSMEKTLPMEEWMKQPITFSAKDVPMNGQTHGYPLVITLMIEEWGVKIILVDTRSSMEVLFYDTFKRMQLYDDILITSTYNIYGFNGTVTVPKREVTLRVSDGADYLDTLSTFCVIDVVSPHEAIIGRPWIAGIKGVASAYHQRLRFPIYKGVSEVVGNPQVSRQCIQMDIQQNEDKRARLRLEKNKANKSQLAKN
ncbi:uncharacterized protein LOC113311937 [Papaver somniferum]|uniref:uncharacterized protein LOC113311937 n=1 Tax=Papaver somniferum TaxID=3469 RepID=UPI000E6FB006|nr:uncharacterized protein LOC113311937 [Papaver somniferum]